MGKYIQMLKYMLFVFNLLFWVTGCTIIAIGIYFVVHNVYGTLFPGIPSITIGNVLILFGCIIMVFGFLGCMGAIKENKCLLLTFFILLLLILLIEVVLAIVLFIYEKEIDPYVTEQLRKSFEDHKQRKENSTIWDDFQTKLQCCGINGSSDWKSDIPSSCCEESRCNGNNVFQEGCADILRTWFENNFLYVGIATICTSLIEFLYYIGVWCIWTSGQDDTFKPTD
ncbi:leukocyte surface antigen CD53 isoform X2 [Dendrobates tinctorius]|uniref:leukocyte surface antigen CD53 isoform X2 n=1 Tax=Dendrobates tinctorius TaxID=92724 RepID=UPI003CC94B86